MDDRRHKPHDPLPEYYRSDEEKPDYLNRLFDTSAHDYDRIIKWGFFGSGEGYRRRALLNAGLREEMKVLDVACGTGAVMEQLAKTVPAARITGLDPSRGMLESARRKFPGANFREGCAEEIPCGDESFDFVVMGYALRHMKTLEEAFQEFHRVLKPGGKVLILEISRPTSRAGLLFTRLYLKHFLPAMTLAICRSRDAQKMMRYYWDSIEACASGRTILEALASSGFQECRNDPELGIFSAFSGIKAVQTPR